MAEDSEGEASSVRERRVSGRRGGSPLQGADGGLLGGAGGRGGGGGGNDPFPFMTGGRFHACSSCRREKSKCKCGLPD